MKMLSFFTSRPYHWLNSVSGYAFHSSLRNKVLCCRSVLAAPRTSPPTPSSTRSSIKEEETTTSETDSEESPRKRSSSGSGDTEASAFRQVSLSEQNVAVSRI